MPQKPKNVAKNKNKISKRPFKARSMEMKIPFDRYEVQKVTAKQRNFWDRPFKQHVSQEFTNILNGTSRSGEYHRYHKWNIASIRSYNKVHMEIFIQSCSSVYVRDNTTIMILASQWLLLPPGFQNSSTQKGRNATKVLAFKLMAE